MGVALPDKEVQKGVRGQKNGSKGKKMHPGDHNPNVRWSVGHSVVRPVSLKKPIRLINWTIR